MHELLAQLLMYLRAAWQHRWYAVAVTWAVCVAGWIYVWMLPNQFEATARVWVDTQSVLRPLLSGLAVQPNVEQRIGMISRTLISRPNVEKVVRMADLDIKVKTSEEREKLVDQVLGKIRFGGAGRENFYSLGYQDQNPELAKRVVQSFLTIFVEGSLGDKRKDTDSARRFIDEQIKAYEQKLVQAENALKEFKRSHLGMMPGQGGDYFSRLSESAGALNQAQLELREAENARDALKNQMTGEEPVMLNQEDLPNAEIDGRIAALKKRMDDLRLNYTEQHPDIVATKRVIAQLEEQKKDEAKNRKPGTLPAAGTNPVLQQLQVSLAEAEARVASMQARVAEYERRLADMRGRADAIPEVEADLTQLNRDYEVNKANYEALLARRESAAMSENMDANAGMVDFRIIDPPRVPLVPSGPNRPWMMTLVLLGALVSGVAVAFLVSQVRPTFGDRRSLREATGQPLLGVVPMIWTELQRRRQKRGALAFGASVAGLLLSYGAVIAAVSMLTTTASGA